MERTGLVRRGQAVRLSRQLDARTAEVVKATAGEEALKLVRIMTGVRYSRDVSEFRMVKSSGLDIQKVRNILYRLHSTNLADYRRVKDNRKGIYVSYWTFNKAAVKELSLKLQQERLERFRERLETEMSNANGFFICPETCTRADFTTAVQHGFRCLECGQLLAQEDNTRTISYLREKIREMEAVA